MARNILRNDFFKLLAGDKNTRTVLFFAQTQGKAHFPEYLKKEFERENIIVEPVPNKKSGPLEKAFQRFVKSVIFSPTSRLFARYGTTIPSSLSAQNALSRLFWLLLYPFFRTRTSRRLIWWMESLFRDQEYSEYFEEYQPSLVLSTNILSDFDLAFLKAARRRGVKTARLPKSWDTLDKMLYRFEPDVMFVQNDWMRHEAAEYQKFKKEKIRVIGFPQFDIYTDLSALESRESYCRRKGLDSKLPILFIGSEGEWSEGDEKIYEKLIEARDQGKLPECNILIRPHYSAAHKNRYEHLRTKPRVFVDDGYRKSDFFVDRWDPSEEDMRDFANTLHHCDLSLNFASTLSLDAVCFNKPIINISFGVRFMKDEKNNLRDMTHLIYQTNYYRAVLATRATTLVRNFEELVSAIKMYLQNPRLKYAERNFLKETMCFKVDGKSGERLYRAIKEIM